MNEQRPSTRDRLREAGLRLFAERGYEAVSVGDIERAVGLAPRRGALYRHFASKAALLEDAVQHHLESVTEARARFELDGSASLEHAEELGRWILSEMDRQHLITRILERDGERLPALRDRFRREVSDSSYAAMATILAGWSPTPLDDGEATATLLLGALVNIRRSTWTLGDSPGGRSDEQLVAAWARLCRDTVARGDAPR